jgi:hypothetical protein
MASFVYDLAREAFLGISSGSINWTNDDIKATLVSSSYSPNQQNHQYVNPSLWAHTGSWTAQTLSSKTVVTGSAGAANVTFTAVPAPYTINAVALFKANGTNSQSQWQLIAYLDNTSITGLPLTGSGADITISWNTGTNKIFKL